MRFSKVAQLFFHDGRLKEWAVYFFALLGIFLVLVPWFTEIPVFFKYLSLCMGSVLGSIAAYADRFGYKSFTNDPLGWRAAKKSYESDETPSETANHKDTPP